MLNFAALLAAVLVSTSAIADDDPLAIGKERSWRALTQGCDVVDGVEYCAFHSHGWKFYVYYDSKSVKALLPILERLPLNLPVVLSGYLKDVGDISADLVLEAVALDPQGDPDAATRAALQGLWVSEDDPRSVMEILGSEVRGLYDGQLADYEYLRLTAQCEDAPTAKNEPYLELTSPEDRDYPRCFSIEKLDPRRLWLSYLGRGNTLKYRRER